MRKSGRGPQWLFFGMAFLVVAFMVVPLLFGAMSDSSAMSKAKRIWGDRAMIGQMRKDGDTYWTRQIGYMDQGAFRVIGEGKMTWEAAFFQVPAGYTPPTSRILTAVARDAAGNEAESAPVQVWVCNPPCTLGKAGRQ